MAATKKSNTKTTTTTTIIKTTTTGGTKKKSSNEFSWSKLLGYTGIKQKISRKTGIPFSKAGRDRKIGAMITNGVKKLFSKGKGEGKSGCCVFFVVPAIISAMVYYWL